MAFLSDTERNVRSLTPARDQVELDRKIAKIEKCGKNMGPHDYMPIQWMKTQDKDKVSCERVTLLMCRVCFVYVDVQTLMRMYGEVKL